jgi:hypothetical protein
MSGLLNALFTDLIDIFDLVDAALRKLSTDSGCQSTNTNTDSLKQTHLMLSNCSESALA